MNAKLRFFGDFKILLWRGTNLLLTFCAILSTCRLSFMLAFIQRLEIWNIYDTKLWKVHADQSYSYLKDFCLFVILNKKKRVARWLKNTRSFSTAFLRGDGTTKSEEQFRDSKGGTSDATRIPVTKPKGGRWRSPFACAENEFQVLITRASKMRRERRSLRA